MKKHFINLCLLTAFLCYGAPIYSETFGRFTGILRHDSLKRDQLAKLDFILSRGDENKLELMAILTLHFGDYKSGEYVSYHFHKVQHNLLTSEFTFDQANQGIVIKEAKLDRQLLMGSVHSVYSGDVGELILSTDSLVEQKYPLIEPIWGEYQGKCDNKKSLLQLYTYRSGADTTYQGNPFASYEVRGQLGQFKSGLGSPSEEGEPFVTNNFYNGSYNFFKKHLILFGTPKNWVCAVDGDELSCNGCSYKRVSDETQDPRQYLPPTSKNVFLKEEPMPPVVDETVESIEGEYSGYLHHEYLNQYQTATINIVTYQTGDASKGLRLSAMATLYFGDETSPEALFYRFTERSFPNPLIAGQFVLERTGDDVDAVIRITSMGKGVLKGEWYSLIFGKVGTFVMTKGERAELPSDVVRMEAVSGDFESTDWDLELLVGPSQKPLNSQNPFYPNVFGGGIYHKDGILRRVPIDGGTYDFYTGRIALEMESPGGKKVWVGMRTQRKRLYFKMMKFRYSLGLPKHDLEAFRLLEQ